MGLNSIKENIKIMASKAVCLAAAGWCILLNKIYAQADLILGNPNIEYAMEESVTTTKEERVQFLQSLIGGAGATN